MPKPKKIVDGDRMRGADVEEMVATPLTDAELADRSQSLVVALDAIDTLKDKQSDAKKKMKLDMDNAILASQDLRDVIAAKSEQRLTPCYEERNFKNGTVRILRHDNHVEVGARKMTDDERQLSIAEVQDSLANPDNLHDFE